MEKAKLKVELSTSDACGLMWLGMCNATAGACMWIMGRLCRGDGCGSYTAYE